MFKQLSIAATLLAIGTGSLNAQQIQQEAVLQKIVVPGAGFDIVLAMPKSSRATIDVGSSPDATVIYLPGGELALPFESWEALIKTYDSLGSPVGSFHAGGKATPVIVYAVAKGEIVTSAVK